MGNNTTIIRFTDLTFKPHPNASALFQNQAIVVLPDYHRISIVGPRTHKFLFDESNYGKYEILYSGWDDPIGDLTEDEVDLLLIKIQKTPLDLIPEMGRHKFI